MRLVSATVGVLALVAGCHSRLPTEPGEVDLGGGLRARAESSIGPGPADEGAIRTRVTITNRSSRVVTLAVDACPVRLRVYRVGASQPAYDGFENGCITIVVPPITIPQGESRPTGTTLDLITVVPPGTAAATYRVEALLRVGAPARPTVLAAGTVRIPVP